MRRVAIGLLATELIAVVAVAASAASTAPTGIAYAKFANGNPTIWSARIDGSHPVKLASSADTPLIAPNGSAVVYEGVPTGRSGQPALRIVPRAGGAARTLARNLRDLEPNAWSPDSSRVAVAVGPELGINRLVIVTVASGATTTIASGFLRGLSWSGDGSRLIYGLAPNSRTYPGSTDLYNVAATGGTPKAITHDHRSAFPIAGPGSIVFQRQNAKQPRNDQYKGNLFTIKSDGSGLHALTHGTAPRFLTGLVPLGISDNGTRLLAEYGGQDTSYAQTVDPTTGAAKTVGSHTDDFIGMALAHDGSTILAAQGGYDPNGKHAIVTFPYAGGKPTVLVPGAYFASWTRAN